MSLFIFSVSGSSSLIARQSADLPNARVACAEGVRFAGRAMEGFPASLIDDKDWTLEITDQNGLLLISVLISVTESPAVAKN